MTKKMLTENPLTEEDAVKCKEKLLLLDAQKKLTACQRIQQSMPAYL